MASQNGKMSVWKMAKMIERTKYDLDQGFIKSEPGPRRATVDGTIPGTLRSV
jgi:hypothetical protein